MKKKIGNILLGSLFFVGLSLLLYPTVSNFVNARNQTRAMTEYEVELENADEDKYRAILEAAHQYNRALLKKPNRYALTKDELQEYKNQLSIAGSEIMGTLAIEKIGVKLPMYHGTSEGVLQLGIGHFAGSSLPVGGADTHAALTGHNGLPEAKLLTDLKKLDIGDTFTLHVLNETLTYTVEEILIVEPDDTGALAIESGKDLCTLITCTPYGINSHRLLVCGVRSDEEKPDIVTEPIPEPQCICWLCFILAVLFLCAVIKVKNRTPKKIKDKRRL